MSGRIYPTDPQLRDAFKEAVKGDPVRVEMRFIGNDYKVREILSAEDLQAGRHRELRDRMERAGTLRAIIHIGFRPWQENRVDQLEDLVSGDVFYNQVDPVGRWSRPTQDLLERRSEIWSQEQKSSGGDVETAPA